MFGVMAVLLTGGALFALSELLSDDDEQSTDDTSQTDDQPEDMGWGTDQIQVTEEGSDTELVDPEEIPFESWNFSTGTFSTSENSSEAMEGIAGTDADEQIETNTHDDTYQLIRGGDGHDTVEIGLGDHVDVRSEDDATGDDVTGEDGDQVIVHVTQDDLENAMTLKLSGPDDTSLSDRQGDVPLFQASLGSGDILEIDLPEGVTGSLHMLQGVNETSWETAGDGPQDENHYAFVLFVPEGQTLPDNLDTDQGAIFAHGDDVFTEADIEGIRVLGKVDLGFHHTHQYSEEPERSLPDSDLVVDLPTISLTGSAA